MDQQGLHVSISDLYCLLQLCIKDEDLAAGRKLRTLIARYGFESNAFLGSHLIRMFALLGCLMEANQVFNKLPEPSVYSWSAIISAHAKLGQGEQAIELYYQMQQSSVKPDDHVFVAVLQACISTAALEQGKLVHSHIIKNGMESSGCIGNCLLDMYAKCGGVKDARNTFDNVPNRGVVTWTAMIVGYTQYGHSHEALHLFKKMQQEGVEPNMVTYVSTLKACSTIAALEQGMMVYDHMIERGFELDVFVGSILVDLYAKCGSLKDAYRVFYRLPKHDVVTWNALIAAGVQQGHGGEALMLFKEMQAEGIEPDNITFVSIVKSCSGIAALDKGRQIHLDVIRFGLEWDICISNALIDMYTKCGRLKDACHVFENLPSRDVVTWSAVITGCAQQEHSHEALQFFQQMQQDGMEPNHVTFVSLLKVCSNIGALDQGKLIHGHIVEGGFLADVCVGSSLIEMYAKCGDLQDACRVFHELPKRDVVTWSAMLEACAHHGDYKLALEYFGHMECKGLKPDEATFVSLLSACSHAGLVEKGFHHLKSMQEYGVPPTLDHYNCILDLLGRAGRLTDASDLVQILPFGSNVFGWTSLLGHCRTHGNVQLGKLCFNHIAAIDCRNAAAYALMSSVYANAGMYEDAGFIEELRIHANAWKKPGMAFIEVENKVHNFVVGGRTHPRSKAIYARLMKISIQSKEIGYMPSLDLVQQPLSDDDKEDVLCGHCERLAIAFGLISTLPGTTIRVSKNLRVCADCHSATKVISKIERREIILTDAYRAHHFIDGECSCKDFF